MPRSLRRLVAALVVAMIGGPVPVARANEALVVIAQIYGGGGNSGAPYTHDYVQLFNRGGAVADLEGWSVQYASATASTWAVTPLSGSLPPGGSYLIRLAAGSGGAGAPLPGADAVGTTNLAASSGKVAVVRSAAPLPCGSSCASAVADLVGYGSANDFEGSGPAPVLGNSLAAIREESGCRDTDDNRSDFLAGLPAPAGSSAAPAPCGGADPEDPPTDPEDPPTDPEACEPLTLEASVSPAVLWPPNRRMVAVSIRGIDGARLEEAVSSEADSVGPGDPGDDIRVLAPTKVLLRAQRLGDGEGRRYTLRYSYEDGCGGTATTETTVHVPHDRSPA